MDNAPEHQVESRLLLDVVITEGTAIFELFTSKDESLLVGGNTAESEYTRQACSLANSTSHAPLLVLNFGLDVIDCVGRLHLKGDGLPSKGLDEDLHLQRASTWTDL